MCLYMSPVHGCIFSAFNAQNGFKIILLGSVIYKGLVVFRGEDNACEPILRFPERTGLKMGLYEIWFIFM